MLEGRGGTVLSRYVPIEIRAGRAQVLVAGGDGEAKGLQNGEVLPGPQKSPSMARFPHCGGEKVRSA